MSFLLKTKYILRGSTKSYNLVKLSQHSCFSLNNVHSRSQSNAAEKRDSLATVDRKFAHADQMFLTSKRITQPLLEDLHDASKFQGRISSMQSFLLIRSCLCLVASPEVRGNFLDKIWRTLLEIDSQIDISHFNAALYGLLEINHKFSTAAFLEEMKKRNITPNRVTYSRLVHKECLEGNLIEANMLLDKMKENDMAITQAIFNSMIIGNSRANNFGGCLDMVNVMKEKELEPDKGTYAALGQAYIEHEKFEEFESLIDELVSKNVQLDVGSLTSFVVFLARKNATKFIHKVTERIERQTGFHAGMMQCILQLIEEKYYDAAYELFKFKTDQPSSYVFFIEKILEKDVPFNEVMKFCSKVEEDMQENFALTRALRFYIKAGNIQNAVATLRTMHENGSEIRQIYFIPLLAAVPTKDLLFRLKELVDLGLKGTLLLCENILPKLEPISDPSHIYKQLLDAGLSKVTTMEGLINYYLGKKDFDTAGNIAKYFPSTTYLYHTIAYKYVYHRHVSSTVAIIRLLVKNRLSKETANKENTDAFTIFVKALSTIISRTREDQMSEVLTPLFLEMANSRVGIPESFRPQISDMIGSGMTPELESALESVINADFASDEEFNDRSSSTLPDIKEVIQYLKDGKFAEAMEIYEKTEESDKTRFLGSVYSWLFKSQIDLATLKEILDGIKQHKFPINRKSTLHYALLCVKDGKFQEAANSILTHNIEDMDKPLNQEDKEFYENMYATICNALNDIDLTNFNLIQESFLKTNYIRKSLIDSQYVSYHLRKKDLESALNAFLETQEKFNNSPHVKKLMNACIAVDDTDKLQKIVDVVSSSSGRSFALLWLAYSSLCMGKDSAANNIFKSPGLKDTTGMTFRECRHLLQNGLVEEAEKLVAYSSSVYGIDRNELYLLLLNHHVNRNDSEKALNLWEAMQEENLQPDARFLSKLGRFLLKRGLDVPFAIPTTEPKMLPVDQYRQQTYGKSVSNQRFGPSAGFTNSSYKREIKENILNFLAVNKFEEAKNLAQDSLSKGVLNLHQLDEVCKILSNLGRTDDLKSLWKLSKIKNYHFSVHLGKSYLNENKMEEYLENMNNLIQEFAIYPHFNSIKIALKKSPELESKILECVKSLPENHKCVYWSALWDKKFWNGEPEKAEEIYQEHIKDGRFLPSCGDLKDEKDFEKVEEVISIIKRKPELRLTSLSVVVGHCAVALAILGKFDEINKLLNDSPEISLKQKQIQYIRKLAEKHNHPLDLTRNKRQMSDSSSSSDSEKD